MAGLWTISQQDVEGCLKAATGKVRTGACLNFPGVA